MFLNFVLFLHLLRLSLYPTAFLLTCMTEALFHSDYYYWILHSSRCFTPQKKKKKSEATMGAERISWVPDLLREHPPFCFLITLLTSGDPSHQRTILPNTSVGAFLCYFVRTFSLWTPGFPVQLILRSWGQWYKF